MSQRTDELLAKLDLLIEKIEILTIVLASKPNSEQVNAQFKDKIQKEQIRILQEFNLPTGVIALMIGTTYNTTRVAISEMKSEKEKLVSATKSNIAKSKKPEENKTKKTKQKPENAEN